MKSAVVFTVLTAITCLLAPAADAAQLKIATVAPDGSYWMTEARKAGDEISQRTSGRVSFRFYPGGTMGDDGAVLRKMRIGQLHGGVFLAGSFAHVAPDLQIYHLPMLFTSYAEVDAIRSKVDATLIAALGAGGYHTFGFIEGGFAYMYSTKNVDTFADLKGRKAWIPEGDKIGKVLVEESAMSPVPLALADVLTGLQTGLVDVVTGPPVGAVALQWFTKVKYMIRLPVIYTFGCVAISDRDWSAMSAADRTVVEDVFGRMTRALDKKSREDNLSARTALEKQGVIGITPDAATARQWEAIARRSSARLTPELGLNRMLLAEVEADLAEFRASETAAGR